MQLAQLVLAGRLISQRQLGDQAVHPGQEAMYTLHTFCGPDLKTPRRREHDEQDVTIKPASTYCLLACRAAQRNKQLAAAGYSACYADIHPSLDQMATTSVHPAIPLYNSLFNLHFPAFQGPVPHNQPRPTPPHFTPPSLSSPPWSPSAAP